VFDFSGSPPYDDEVSRVPSLDWSEPSGGTSVRNGANVTGLPWLQSEGPASSIADAVRGTNAFTLLVTCATDDVSQHGPARIISNSWSIVQRNFTLGQQGTDMAFRFRTPHNGPSGARPEVIVPGVFADTGLREILVTYDGATLQAAVAGSAQVHRTDLTPGSSLALAWTNLEVRATELQLLNMVYLAALFSTPGMLMAVLGRTRRRALALGLLWVLVFTVLLEVTLMFASGRPWSLENVGRTVGVGALVVSLAVMLSTGGLKPEPVRS